MSLDTFMSLYVALCRKFERRLSCVLRMSPGQLLTLTSVDAVATAVRETTAPTRQIAIECGFYEQALLCRQFRQAT
jgi:transcriptional regulator GlxA family with amidase domain